MRREIGFFLGVCGLVISLLFSWEHGTAQTAEETTTPLGQVSPDPEMADPPQDFSHIGPQRGDTIQFQRAEHRKRFEFKPPIEGNEIYTASPTSQREPLPWQCVGFSSGIFYPPPGIDPVLVSEIPALAASVRDSVFALLLMDEYLGPANRQELE